MIEVYEHPLENGARLLILRGDRESDKDAINAHLDGLRIQPLSAYWSRKATAI